MQKINFKRVKTALYEISIKLKILFKLLLKQQKNN